MPNALDMADFAFRCTFPVERCTSTGGEPIIASLPFRLQSDATLKEALKEMTRRRIRRVFVNNSNAFISDRTAIGYIFSPEGIQVLKRDLDLVW